MSKVFKWKILETPPPPYLKEHLKKYSSDLRITARPYHEVLRGLVKECTSTIDLILDRARLKFTVAKKRERYGQDEVYVAAYFTCCHQKCGTCLGKYPLHYPYLRVADAQGKTIEEIESRKVREWLYWVGLDVEDIEVLHYAMKLRHWLIRLYHCEVLIYNHLELVEMKHE